MKRPNRHFLALSVALALLGTAPHSLAAGRTAVLLFISSETMGDLVVPVSELRETTLGYIHENLEASGHQLLSAATVDEAAGRWRVRNDWALSRPFLNHLSTDLGVDQLQVVHLRVEQLSLSLIIRGIDCPSGTLKGVQLPTVDVSSPDPKDGLVDREEWLAALADLCHFESPVSPEAGDTQLENTLLVLPAEGIGCEEDRALTTTACMLRMLLAENEWAIPDPGLVATTLSSQGVAPFRVGRKGRELLRETFASDELLRVTLVAYDKSNLGGGTRATLDTPLALGGTLNFADFDLSLRSINLVDGTVTLNRSLFAPVQSQEGWFGVLHFQSSQTRIENATGELWQDFRNLSKDH